MTIFSTTVVKWRDGLCLCMSVAVARKVSTGKASHRLIASWASLCMYIYFTCGPDLARADGTTRRPNAPFPRSGKPDPVRSRLIELCAPDF